jgi:hypothetical protein
MLSTIVGRSLIASVRTNERSIFSASTGSRARWLSDE